jgi:cupin 2 domain-containing protein
MNHLPPTPAGNLLENLPPSLAHEQFEDLLHGDSFVLRRIVSLGHVTPPGEWYDQPDDEWVVLLSGAATLQLEGEATVRTLQSGDWILLRAHVRHRVEWTDNAQHTVWLALHFDRAETKTPGHE